MIVLYILAWLWSAPQSLLGLALLPFYGPTAAELHAGRLMVKVTRLIGFKDTTGQTLGCVSFFKPEADSTNAVHEGRHALQSDVLGPLWGPLYVLAGFYAMLAGGHFYLDNWFERDARRAAGQEV